MQAAIITPIPELPSFGGLTDYHLILANNCTNDTYRQWYINAITQGDFVILDNSAHELGEGTRPETIISILDQGLFPSEIVLPDRMFFGEDTVRGSIKAYKYLENKVPADTGFMVVPQGRTLDEYLHCAVNLLVNIPKITCIGVSKDYEVWPGGLRALIFNILGLLPYLSYGVTNNMPKPSIHCLGWGRDLSQLMGLTDIEEIRGIDSAKPIVFAQGDIELDILDIKSSVPIPYPGRVHNFMESTLTPDQKGLAYANINTFMALAQGKWFV